MAQTLTEDQVRSLLGDGLLDFLISTVDDGSLTFREHLKLVNKRYNPTLAATYMRWWMKDALEQANGVQFTEQEHGFWLSSPANIGIWFEYAGVKFRAYKVRQGKAPMPGGAKHRVDFLSNIPEEQGNLLSEWKGNIVLLWSFNAQGEIIGFRAVHPDGFDEDGQLKLSVDLDLVEMMIEKHSSVQSQFAPEQDDTNLLAEPETVAEELQRKQSGENEN